MNTTIIVICATCMIAAIILDNKCKIPLGITCMGSALIICYFAFQMSASKVISQFFPSTVVMPLILAMIYFGVFTENGTSQVIAKYVIGLIRGNMRLYPWVLFVLCTGLYMILDGGALRYIITPLIFGVAVAGGASVLMAISTAYLSFVAGSLNPFVGIDATTRGGILADMGLGNSINVSLALWINTLILIILTHAFIYIITKSWNVPNIAYHGSDEKVTLTPNQKKSFLVLIVTVIIFVVPPVLRTIAPSPVTVSIASIFSFYFVFVCGILAVVVLKLGDWNSMVKRVSVKPVVMIIGVTMLIKTAQQAGLQELCTMAASAVPNWLVGPVLLLISAGLSFFVSAPTVQPMLFPMAAAMATTPAQAIIYLSCVTIGLAASGVSPISSSGAAFLSTVEESEQPKYSKYLFIMAFLAPAFMAVCVALGILNPLSFLLSNWYF